MNKKVFITGANGSLGSALAGKFSSENFELFLNVRKANLKLNEIKKINNKKIEIIKGDLTKNKTIKAIAKKIKEKKISILINNAGIYLNKEFNKSNNKEIKKIFDVNFFSNVFLLKELLSLRVRNLTVVNINSIAGKQGSANESIYSSSKHAMKGFYESAEKEKELNGFNFINLFPGAFKSKITIKRNDFKKLIQPKEIADIVYQLSANYNSLKINNLFIKRKIY
tara:strand:- start:724 stop:1398 length:675 start_codon:yes stop_codon:yes gene_type:complete